MNGPNPPNSAPADTTCCDSTKQSCPDALGNLTVTVINDEDKTKVSGVDVKISGPQDGKTASDKSGEAAFKCIKVGPYKIRANDSCFTGTSTSKTVEADKTTMSELHVHHIHAVITIQKLTFSGNNVVEKDTTGDFPSPEWVEGRPQADQSPVAYARNKKIVCKPEFKVTTAPCRTESVAVKGTVTLNFKTSGSRSLEWIGTVTVKPRDKNKTVTPSASLTSNIALADEVGIFESSDITWQMNPAGQGWASAGITRNVLYVTLGNPTISPNFWTLLDISCRAAAGTQNEDDFVKASFAPFSGTLGDGKGFKRKRDNKELTYYKLAAGTPSSGVFECKDLLSRPDGTGRCGAWGNFLVSMHKVHGITSSNVIGVVPIDASLLIVKNCNFTGPGTLPVPFTHVGITECVKNDGIPGQGKDNPQFTFGDHALVKHSTGIYDPSYGVGPKPDLKTCEDGGIAGIGEGFLAFIYKGDPQLMPGTCSPGFIKYTVLPGETLASIATKFGIASGTALYNHPYNETLRKTHTAAKSWIDRLFSLFTSPSPPSVSTGDKLIIPREIASKLSILKIM